MKRLTTYFISGCIICGYCNLAVAGTSIISNVLTQSNSYLKEAGLVQKKYSGIAREYASMKVGIPDNLAGGQVAAATAQARGIQEQAERVQEQIEMANEAQANAMAKVNDLNSKLAKGLADAQAGLSEGIAITESFKTSITQAVDTVKNAPDLAKGLADKMVNTVKDTAMSTVDSIKDTANSVKDQATGIANDAKSAVGKNEASAFEDVSEFDDSNTDNASSITENVETIGYRNPVGVSQSYQNSASVQDVSSVVMQIVPAQQGVQPMVQQNIQSKPVSNQADAIHSASVMADTAVAVPMALPVMDNLPMMEVNEAKLSAADIMAAAADMQINTAEDNVQRSSLNAAEQLQQASNRAYKDKMMRSKSAKLKATKAVPTEKTRRRQFNVSKTADAVQNADTLKKIKVELKQTDTEAEKLSVAQKQTVIKERTDE